MAGLWLSAWGVAHSHGGTEGPDRLAWIIVLLIQSVPYASSVLVSLVSAFRLPAGLLGTTYRSTAATARPPIDPSASAQLRPRGGGERTAGAPIDPGLEGVERVPSDHISS